MRSGSQGLPGALLALGNGRQLRAGHGIICLEEMAALDKVLCVPLTRCSAIPTPPFHSKEKA